MIRSLSLAAVLIGSTFIAHADTFSISNQPFDTTDPAFMDHAGGICSIYQKINNAQLETQAGAGGPVRVSDLVIAECSDAAENYPDVFVWRPGMTNWALKK